MSNVQVIHSVGEQFGDCELLFQWCEYHYDDGSPAERGYRFIWRGPDGNLRPQRGQARIPDAAVLLRLLSRASADGWFVAAES